MPPFKDEYILIIAPGSQTTLAQLGLPDSFTPAKLRLPTRMFPAETPGQWEPVKIREKARSIPKASQPSVSAINGSQHDTEMKDGTECAPATNGASKLTSSTSIPECFEDPLSTSDAVYPITAGRITNWTCFLALLTHVHNTLSPPLHTPIIIVAQPAWTEQDYEIITQFFFEKFKTPAFSIIDAALAVCYAYGVHTATVIDVGYEKTDVTAVSEFVKHEVGRGAAVPACGGETMTRRLLEVLASKEWTKDMCEQLKRSNVCEILPRDTMLPTVSVSAAEGGKKEGANTSSSSNATEVGQGHKESTGGLGEATRVPGVDTEVGEEGEVPGVLKEDGVLDVAAIVASGKTQEYLARKEREKQERAAAKRAAADAVTGPAKPTRLPNSRREKNTFTYEERKTKEEIEEEQAKGDRQAEEDARIAAEEQAKAAAAEAEADADAAMADSGEVKADDPSAAAAAAAAAPTDPAPTVPTPYIPLEKPKPIPFIVSPMKKREIEVSTERFLAHTPDLLDRLADSIHHTISAVPEVGKRAELWDSLVIVGNGSRIRGKPPSSALLFFRTDPSHHYLGFKDALLATLTARYIISPSSATIFTSELPSNLSTPLATGANTPLLQPHFSSSSSLLGTTTTNPGGPTAGGNPLLLAATTAHAANASMSTPSSHLTPALLHHNSSSGGHNPGGHGQSPTRLGTLRPPEYFPEWKDVGFEEAAFLGAQVAAKVVFVVDGGLTKGFLSRAEYNEGGPGGGAGVGL